MIRYLLGFLSVLLTVTTVNATAKVMEVSKENQKLQKQVSYSDEEINNYEETVQALAYENGLLQKASTREAMRQTKIQEVRNIIKLSLVNLPSEAREITGTQITAISRYIVDYSEMYDIPLNIAVALIKHESAFNIRAVSRTGAQGLAQLMPSTAEYVRRQLGKNEYDPWNPQHNIQFGLFYFSTLMDMYRGQPDQVKLAVNAYNMGPNRIVRELPAETIQHETYIFRYASEYRRQGL